MKLSATPHKTPVMPSSQFWRGEHFGLKHPIPVGEWKKKKGKRQANRLNAEQEKANLTSD